MLEFLQTHFLPSAIVRGGLLGDWQWFFWWVCKYERTSEHLLRFQLLLTTGCELGLWVFRPNWLARQQELFHSLSPLIFPRSNFYIFHLKGCISFLAAQFREKLAAWNLSLRYYIGDSWKILQIFLLHLLRSWPYAPLSSAITGECEATSLSLFLTLFPPESRQNSSTTVIFESTIIMLQISLQMRKPPYPIPSLSVILFFLDNFFFVSETLKSNRPGCIYSVHLYTEKISQCCISSFVLTRLWGLDFPLYFSYVGFFMLPSTLTRHV